MTMEQGIGQWLIEGDVGASSRFMAAVMLDADAQAEGTRKNHPLDPADFGRCLRLVEAVPEIQSHLDALRGASPTWNTMIDRWDEMARIYHEEYPSGLAPRLYALMQTVRGVRR